MQLKDTHAAVTGAGSGIGAAIASALLAEGARVSLMGRRLEPLQALAAGHAEAAKTQAVSCDVSEAASVKQAFANAVDTFGAIGVLVNCAGAAPTQVFHKLTTDEWNAVMAVNLNGVFHCTSQVINAMRAAKSGRIINIASTAALKGYAYVSAYCAAKHGVLGLTRALALETAKLGVTVNAICPGYTDTSIIRDSVAAIAAKTGRSEADALGEFTSTNPQGRLIDPEEVAAMVLWLCADSSYSITGQALSLSGGEVM